MVAGCQHFLVLLLFVAFTISSNAMESRYKMWSRRRHPFFEKTLRFGGKGKLYRRSSKVTRMLSPILVGLDRSLSSISLAAAVIRPSFRRDGPINTLWGGNANLARGGAGEMAAKTKRINDIKKNKTKMESKKGKSGHEKSSPLSGQECFIPLENIGDLTLRDVGTVFAYAVNSTREDFDEKDFLDNKPAQVKPIVHAMEQATARCRGENVKRATTGKTEHISGDIEAFNFCAAMRILAEWRVLRQVPEGNKYKQYAAAMNMGKKDVIQNIGKIEKAAHEWMDHQQRKNANKSLEFSLDNTSPTLRDILQFEKEMNIHEKLPKLRDNTGAMGALWNRRGLDFHVVLFEKLLDVPQKYSTAGDAVSAAYNAVFGDYHGWTIRKIFNYSFNQAPDIEEVYKVMNPRKLKELMNPATHPSGPPPLHSKKRLVMQVQVSPDNPLERFHWENTPQSPEANGGRVQGWNLEDFVRKEMRKDAQEHVRAYLRITKPILEDLARLFDEFNMNDPSKVG